MSRPSDAWFVRFPDGRVMHANSTVAVRHHLQAGRIPADSRVRRTIKEDWTSLDKAPEFADLVPKRRDYHSGARAASPREPLVSLAEGRTGGVRPNGWQLHAVGVRGLAGELLVAMDSTLVRAKLIIAALAGLLGAAVFIASDLSARVSDWRWLSWVGGALGFLLIWACCSALLTQMTFLELSRLRPGRRAEIATGVRRNLFRLLIAQLAVGGTAIAAIVFLRWVPAWLLDSRPPEALGGPEVFAGTLTAVALVLQVLLWPVLGFTLLLAPLILVEECSIGQALWQWWGLVRRHLTQVFLYESLAASLAGVASLPFVFPVALALGSAPLTGSAGSIAQATLILLTGLALTPLIAYLIVANVFIYLNLRYEHPPLAH
jgi:hypothetical protein